tara:strand:+ start:265 stop:399 length:135 start_codon:yes stop_codon:yes gene_type:complete
MKYPFWTLFFVVCYGWYIFVTIMVSVKGIKNIKQLIRDIEKKEH